MVALSIILKDKRGGLAVPHTTLPQHKNTKAWRGDQRIAPLGPPTSLSVERARTQASLLPPRNNLSNVQLRGILIPQMMTQTLAPMTSKGSKSPTSLVLSAS